MSVTGAILAGGDSRRMGRDKALLEFNGYPLVEIIRDCLHPICEEVLLVSREEKTPSLSGVSGVRLIHDQGPQRGPLVGIQAALRQAEQDWVLVVGCDMPGVRPEVLDKLLQRREDWDAVVPQIDGHHEPLLACYHRRCLPAIDEVLEQALDRNVPRRMRAIPSFLGSIRLRELTRREVQEVDLELASLRNINTPEQWDEFRNL